MPKKKAKPPIFAPSAINNHAISKTIKGFTSSRAAPHAHNHPHNTMSHISKNTLHRLTDKAGLNPRLDHPDDSRCLDDVHNGPIRPTAGETWKRRAVGVDPKKKFGSTRHEYELTEQAFEDDLPETLKRVYFALLALPDNEDVPTAAHVVFGGNDIIILSQSQQHYYLDNCPPGITPSQVHTMMGRINNMHQWYLDAAPYPEPTDAQTDAHTAYCKAMLDDAKQNPTAAATLAELIAYAPNIADGCNGIYLIFGREGEAFVKGCAHIIREGIKSKTITVYSDPENDSDAPSPDEDDLSTFHIKRPKKFRKSQKKMRLQAATAKELHDRIVQLRPQFAPAAYRQVIEAASSPFDGCCANGFRDDWEGTFDSVDEVADRLAKGPPLPAFTLGNLEALLFGRCNEPAPHAGE